MFILGDRVFEMGWFETRRCRNNHQIAVRVDGLLVSIQASEEAFRGNVDLVWILLSKCFDSPVGLRLESVSDGC